MHILRSIRGIATYARRCPIVDKSTFKGGYSRNIHLEPAVHNLLPCSFSHRLWIKINENSFTKLHRQTFSTTKSLLGEDSLSQADLKKAIDGITDQFMETRELLEDARESVDTVYFSEDMEEASAAVKKTLEEYEHLLSKLTDVQKQEVLRTIGLKMSELKAQQDALLHDE